ncbi:SAGA-associated factor 29 [Apiospora arundinis]
MASENAVLFSRAWTLQELLLPPRLLMFTDRGPIWYCNESFQPATDPIPFDFMLYFKGSYQSLLLEESPGSGLDRPTKLFTESQIIDDIFNISTFADGWVRLVEMYTSRHVAFRQDRLRALAGLAKKFQQQSKAEYVAGLWDDKASLPFLLVWDAVPVESKREKPCEDPTDCTRSWNPPSWSWASVEGAISWTWDLDDFRADAQIMDISCQWQDANRFSTSLGGEITMKARALKLPHSSLSYSSQDDPADIKIPYEDLFSQELLFQVPAQTSRLNDYDHTAAEHFHENLEKLFSLSMEIILT